MIGIAVASLWAALIGAVATMTLRPSGTDLGARVVRQGGPTLMAAGLVVATFGLGRALWTLDLSLTYVADHARGGTSAPYRLAGLWGGASGSLLFFTALLAVVVAGLAVSDGPMSVSAARFGGGTVVALMVMVLWFADPFDRLAIPAIDGGGLQPILEHPAMLYHPPILYLGLVSAIVPFLVAVSPSGLPDRWRRVARRSLGVTLGLLTAGLATGANWAYVELGWGGYWGWDPVENGVLVPWLLAIAALHGLRQPGHDRRIAALCALPWVFVLVGSAITRAGIGGSVHAFADDERLGWALLVLIGMTAALVAVQVIRVDARPRGIRRLLGVNLALTGCAAFVVAVAVLYPIPAPGEPLVTGHFYATLLGPLAVAGLIVSAWALGPVSPRRAAAAVVIAVAFAVLVGASTPFSFGVAAGVGLILAALGAGLMSSTTARWATRLGHLGFAVLLIGVAGSTEGDRVTATLSPGEEVTVGSQVFRHVGVEVVPKDDVVSSVRATIEMLEDGSVVRTMTPELAAYTERSVLVAETSLLSTPRRDVQVALRNANDGGVAIYDISVVPLTWWVWWGAIAITASGILVAARPRAAAVQSLGSEPGSSAERNDDARRDA